MINSTAISALKATQKMMNSSGAIAAMKATQEMMNNSGVIATIKATQEMMNNSITLKAIEQIKSSVVSIGIVNSVNNDNALGINTIAE
nr:hypothetical protein [Spirochaetia bacterium]